MVGLDFFVSFFINGKKNRRLKDYFRDPIMVILCKHKNHTPSGRWFFVFLHKWKQISFVPKNKKPAPFGAGFLLRRKRDSNPRRCDPQQFSRLPHSTTLPFLQKLVELFSSPTGFVIYFFFPCLSAVLYHVITLCVMHVMPFLPVTRRACPPKRRQLSVRRRVQI
jgi:hypothetical protein